jgi:hypothetical protein
MNEKPKMHEVPQSGWVEVWTQCREVLEDGTVCPDCKGSGKKAVPVSVFAHETGSRGSHFWLSLTFGEHGLLDGW